MQGTSDEIGLWADSIKPDRTMSACALKLVEEASEFMASGGTDMEEVADILIVALDACYVAGVDPLEIISKKMLKNKARTWGVLPDGRFKHR
jgi:predicted house-cleaning noncanonical NTP pyrophosphatase (MazG superfamily)